MDPEEFAAMFGTASTNDPGIGDRSNDELFKLRTSLGDLIQGIENAPMGLTGSGPLESAIFGASDEETVRGTQLGRLQALARGITGAASPDLRNARTALKYLQAQDYMKAYESLKGAGQITEYEGRTAADAQSIFNQASAGDDKMLQEAQRYLDGIDFGMKRGELGVKIDDKGVETRENEDGSITYGITYRDTDGVVKFIEAGSANDPIHNIPSWLTEEQARNFRRSLGEDAVYFYRGKIYNDKDGRHRR